MVRSLAALLLLTVAAGSACARTARLAEPIASQQLDCDALSISQRLDAATLRDLGPAHSLDAAAAVLEKHKVKFQRTRGVMQLSGVTEKLMHSINTLPQGEPIILPAEQGSAICVIRPSADSI